MKQNDKDILYWGSYCDLSDCEQALEIASRIQETKTPFTWTDYSTDGETWDEESYYDDFMAWWESLTNETRRMVKSTIDAKKEMLNKG